MIWQFHSIKISSVINNPNTPKILYRIAPIMIPIIIVKQERSIGEVIISRVYYMYIVQCQEYSSLGRGI